MGDCSACGHDLRPSAKYCDQCGVRLSADPVPTRTQVTVLCGDIAAPTTAAGPGFDRCAAIVARCGGTVDAFTGDSFRAWFGARTALADHALCACMAALEIQSALDHPGRFGLNSGEVVVGDQGSTKHLLDVARKMQAAAPSGGVLLSNTTALLVADRAALGPLLLIEVKGDDNPIPAHRLLSARAGRRLNYG
ncbi:adenylate/guanylate cyclase domain-containing protein [Mycobacterium sp. ACS4331]|uniref:adenylate/guanylate cyclase domain-containing protein n=1 Tax=Mycobacterium sp. ACS4331 TaxID=1834121 RepID=UPI00080226E6|nr:adenylate/guanylate cyclase domain-containing protein [Mycobacterium sp. ACS4331]OBF29709.1 hypothetical protein A5727_23905 [Mycobacterium sp. ACS4331]